VARAIRSLHDIELRHLQLQDFAVEEQQRVEGLILSQGGYVAVNRQMGQKCLDLDHAEFAQMATVVEQHKPANPMNVRLFSPKATLLQANPLPNDVQQH